MKFCKRYQEYMKGMRGEELPAVDLKRLKNILRWCRGELQSQKEPRDDQIGRGSGLLQGSTTSTCPAENCPVCDGTFFPCLLTEMSAVVDCFNKRAQRLLKSHPSSGFQKLFIWFKVKFHRSRQPTMIQEGRDLVTYAVMNSLAMRKILKKYDKVHESKQGQAFISQAQNMHIGFFQSPWLYELIAFYVNLGEDQANWLNQRTIPGLLQDCSLTFDGDKPTLSCGLFDSLKLEIDLTCSICLETVFDAVSLTCGHIFCFMCSCTAASVIAVDGLKGADPEAKCPLCRRAGVYKGAVQLDELNILLRQSCHDYWDQRLKRERVERVRQAKEYWESQCRAFMGV